MTELAPGEREKESCISKILTPVWSGLTWWEVTGRNENMCSGDKGKKEREEITSGSLACWSLSLWLAALSICDSPPCLFSSLYLWAGNIVAQSLSKCGPWTSGTGTPFEPVRNAHAQAAHRSVESETWRVDSAQRKRLKRWSSKCSVHLKPTEIC